MRLIDFLNFILGYGKENKIEFIVLYVDSDFMFKCHLDDLYVQSFERFERFKSAFITVLNFNCNQLHIEAETEDGHYE